ncbi:hypothetical protein Tco_0935348 [Tanacetum coccineum]
MSSAVWSSLKKETSTLGEIVSLNYVKSNKNVIGLRKRVVVLCVPFLALVFDIRLRFSLLHAFSLLVAPLALYYSLGSFLPLCTMFFLLALLGVGVSGGGEAILHAVNRLIEDRGDDVGLSMLLVDFKNAFNLVDREVMLQEVRTRCPAISRWVEFCYTNPTRLYYGEHALRSCQGVQQGD